MRKYLIILPLFLLSPYASADVKDAVGNFTKSVVKFTKEVTSGIAEGMKEGRSSTESSDGSVVVTNEAEALEFIEISLLSVLPSDEGKTTVVELGFNNKHSKPVTITGLDGKGALIVIDDEGYSNSLVPYINKLEVSIPNQAAKKQKFYFKGEASKAKQVRVWTKNYTVSK